MVDGDSVIPARTNVIDRDGVIPARTNEVGVGLWQRSRSCAVAAHAVTFLPDVRDVRIITFARDHTWGPLTVVVRLSEALPLGGSTMLPVRQLQLLIIDGGSCC